MKSLINQFPGTKMLITTSQWFICPDGKSYRSVWGDVELFNDKSTLGITTNDRSANWYAVVGVGETRVIIAGCQIHYAVVCMKKPSTDDFVEQKWFEAKGEYVDCVVRTNIWLAQ